MSQMSQQVSLRDYKYTSYDNQSARRLALTKAIASLGWTPVYNRLAVVTDYNVSNNTPSYANMQEDLNWVKSIESNYNINNTVNTVKNIVNNIKNDIVKSYVGVSESNATGQVKLRSFGYSSMDSDDKRHEVLDKAAASVGDSLVIKRLNTVAELSSEPRRSIYQKDAKWVNDKYNMPPPPPPTPVPFDMEQVRSVVFEMEKCMKKLLALIHTQT